MTFQIGIIKQNDAELIINIDINSNKTHNNSMLILLKELQFKLLQSIDKDICLKCKYVSRYDYFHKATTQLIKINEIFINQYNILIDNFNSEIIIKATENS